jgi:pilus assembly protein Flp/PilA
MLSFFRRLEDRGASAVEYGLLIAGIAGIIVLTVFAFGDVVKEALFDDTCSVINAEVAASASC